jgi:uncharacterized protein YggE
MKKIWLFVAGAVLIMVAAGLVGCSSGNTPSNGNVNVALNSQQEGIWVTGEGKVTVVPNLAIISLGIQSQEATVEEAQAKAATAMDDVMKALENAGIDRTDIQTQYFNIQQVTRWDNDKQQEVVIGFQVTNTVTAKVRDVTKAGPVIDAVVAAGGDLTRINSISFDVDDPTQYQEQARVKAINDAAAKAKQLADTAGVKLGNPIYITESSYIPGPIYRDVTVAVPAPTPTTPISPGEMEITVDVQMAYAITK